MKRNRDRNRSRVSSDFARGLGLFRLRGGNALASLRSCLLIGLLIWGAIAVIWAWKWTPTYSTGAFARYQSAKLINSISPSLGQELGWNVPTTEGPTRYPFAVILDDQWHQERADIFGKSLLVGVVMATAFTSLAGYGAFGWLSSTGRRARRSETLRGARLLDDSELSHLLHEEGGIASDLKIGNVPLITGSETNNILMIGTIGTGKTEAIKHLLDVIQARGDMAIVYDTKGQLVARYMAAERGDVLLNPLDRRSASWSPWAEIRKSTHPEALANALIPVSSKHERFWHDAARVLLRETIMSDMDDPERSVGALVETILKTTREELRMKVRDTEAEIYLEEGLERMGGSIRGNLNTYIKPLRYLPPDAGGEGDFSIRQFVGDMDDAAPGTRHPWLWLTSQSDDHDAIMPLLSCWADLAMSALLSLPVSRERRLWFIFDELASLGRMSKFISLMERGREHGGCVVLGLQDKAQMESNYGYAEARTLLGQIGTKAIFRVTDPESCRWASDIIGNAEVSESSESARYDPGDTESDIHLSSHVRVKPLVMPSEIAGLPNLHCYLKLPGYPAAGTVLLDPGSIDRPWRNADFEPSERWEASRPAGRDQSLHADDGQEKGSEEDPPTGSKPDSEKPFDW